MPDDRPPAADDQAPPSWTRIYALVLGLLLAWIVLFYLFTARYAPAS